MDNDVLVEVHPCFEAMARQRGFYSTELMQRIAEHGTLHDLEEVPKDIRDLFVTAHDITPEVHIRMQAAFQKFTDNAVSKTVNFANGAEIRDVARVYELAYQLDCKGRDHIPRRIPRPAGSLERNKERSRRRRKNES